MFQAFALVSSPREHFLPGLKVTHHYWPPLV